MQPSNRGQADSISCINHDESHGSVVDFAAQDDTFLDSVSEMLQRLADECSKALEWSSESEAIVGDAREAFESIACLCRHAGLDVAGTEELDEDKISDGDAQPLIVVVPETSLAIEVPSPCYSDSGLSRREPSSTQPCKHANSGAWSTRSESVKERGNDSRLAMSPVRREEIIEIELTDLLTHTHEEIQHCRNELSDQLHQADARHSEAQSQTQADVQALQRVLESSHLEMARIQQEVHDTRQSMGALQSSVLESQRSMETAMKEQTRQWKAICNDLIVEKRNVAKKLAEERGKCASMKEHLAMHDNQVHTRERRSSPQSRRDVYATQNSSSHTPVPEIELEAPKTSSLCPVSPLVAASPAKSSIEYDFELVHSDLYSEGRDDSTCSSPGFRSAPSSIADSGRSGDCNGASIHSPKRKLTSSDLSTSNMSNSRHRSPSVTSSSRSGGISSGVKLQLKLEPRSDERLSTSFRRYYLSSKQQLSTSNSSNSSSVSRITPLSR